MKLNISLSYTSNFKFDKNNKKNVVSQYQNKILSKNLIYFLLFFKSLQDNNKRNNNAIKLFFKPTTINKYTVLRAPYRYKISRNQIELKRFNFVCKKILTIPYLDCTDIISFSDINAVTIKILNFFKDYNTNMCIQNKIRISFSVKFKDYFNINNL